MCDDWNSSSAVLPSFGWSCVTDLSIQTSSVVGDELVMCSTTWLEKLILIWCNSLFLEQRITNKERKCKSENTKLICLKIVFPISFRIYIKNVISAVTKGHDWKRERGGMHDLTKLGSTAQEELQLLQTYHVNYDNLAILLQLSAH